MNLLKPLVCISLTALLFATAIVDDAMAKKGRKPRYYGKSGAVCQNFPPPPPCLSDDKRNPITGKTKNALMMNEQLCSRIKAHKEKTKERCYLTSAYRPCDVNKNTRGSARNSHHLCGNAADFRIGTCQLGDFHGRGTAPHKHMSAGACGR